MSDLVTNLLRAAYAKERRNRELNLSCFIILVTLGVAASTLAYLWFSALLAALLAITSFGLGWYAFRPGLKPLTVTPVDIAQLVDRALPTKDRATTLTNLGDGPTPFERASRELIQTQLHQVLSAACAARSIQTSPIERCVAALQIAPLILSACAKRSLIFAGVLLFVIGLLVTLRPTPPLEQLADELRAAVDQTPNLPQPLREKIEEFAESLASTTPGDGGATRELMNTASEIRHEIAHSATSVSGDSTTIHQSPQNSLSQPLSTSPAVKQAPKSATSQQPTQKEKQVGPEREKDEEKKKGKEEEKERNRPEENQPKDSRPQDTKKESDPSTQAEKTAKQDGTEEGSGTQQNGSSSGSSQQKATQQGAQDGSSQASKQDSTSQQGSQQSAGGSSGNGSQGSGGQGSSPQGNDQSNEQSSGKTGGSGSNGSQGSPKSDNTNGDGKNSQQGSKGDAPNSSSQGGSSQGTNGSQKDSGQPTENSPQQPGTQQQGTGKSQGQNSAGQTQGTSAQNLEQVMQKIDQQLQGMQNGDQGGSGSGTRGEQPGKDGDSPQGDGDSKGSESSSQSKAKQGKDGKSPGSEKGEQKKGAPPRGPSQGSGERQGSNTESDDSAENNSDTPPHDPLKQNPRDGSAKGFGQRSGQPQEPKGIREVADTGNAPSGVGDPALDTQRELLKGSNEQLDLRFTEKDASIEKNNQPALPKTTIEEMQLDKPKGSKERGEQPIPLEYRDLLR